MQSHADLQEPITQTIYGPSNLGITISGLGGNDWITGGNGNDTIYGGAGNDNLHGQGGNDVLHGDEGDDYIFGDNGNDYLYGGSGNDYLYGGNGDDTLDGGSGNDNLSGNEGDDAYLYGKGSGHDIINDNEGNDVVLMGTGLTPDSLIYTISGINGDNGLLIKIKDTGETLRLTQWFDGNQYKIESFQFEDGSVLTASQAEAAAMGTIIGTDGNDNISGPANMGVSIYGLAGNDHLNGGNGNDTIYGGAGNDNLYGQGGNDNLSGDEGDDYIFGDNGNDYLYGGSGNDYLYGGNDNDTLDGGIGNDNLSGNEGDDAYIFGRGYGSDNMEDEGGNDTLLFTGLNRDEVQFAISGVQGDNGLAVQIQDAGERIRLKNWFASPDMKVETFRFEDGTILTAAEAEALAIARGLTGTDNSDDLYGPSNLGITISGLGGNDWITGGNGNDTIYGGAGNDNLHGQGGNDVLYGDEDDDYIFGDNGNDYLYGGSGNDYLYGGNDNDTLDGGSGNDNLSGNEGDDAYHVDNMSDAVAENVNEGTDTVFSSISYTLPANVENLTLVGTSPINATGNALDNIIFGNEGANRLTGMEGADIMMGGAGNDTFFVDNTGDVITEYADEGTDTVYSSITFTLTANVENLTLTGNDEISGTGNSLDNIIIGNDADNMLSGKEGNDTLVGGAGADRMSGGTGDDAYYVDNAGDYVKEKTNEGIDTVYSSISCVLADNVENLTLVKGSGMTASAAIGNDLDNVITGNDMNNYLMGGAGSDTYQFSLGGGSDIINDAGLDEATDCILFTDTVPKEAIAFFQNDTTLRIAYGDADSIAVCNQNTAGIEKMQLSDGLFLTDSDINLIIQQMTAFAADNGIAINNVNDVKSNQELMGMVVSAWHG